MSLPPYSPNVYWTDYKIDTPTFMLAPVEKPDMSPFLFHMSGRNQIVSILTGKTKVNHGFLRACVPESNAGTYNAEVVCFTESPTFALDFFRYRSFRRWKGDQRFGIGFDKTTLVKELGIRPCVYADDKLRSDILKIKNYIEHNSMQDQNLDSMLKSLILGVYPLTTPLLENDPSQGYMWEREWRYSNSNDGGLIFDYSTIRVICCPSDEEGDIRKLLGSYAEKIQFIRSWHEYNEVTSYLKRRQIDAHIPRKDSYSDNNDYISAINEQINAHRSILETLNGHKKFIESMVSKGNHVDEEIAELENTIQKLNKEIEKIKNKLK